VVDTGRNHNASCALWGNISPLSVVGNVEVPFQASDNSSESVL